MRSWSVPEGYQGHTYRATVDLPRGFRPSAAPAGGRPGTGRARLERFAVDGTLSHGRPAPEPERFRQVTAGLYENVRALPRAFLVRRARQVPAAQVLDQLGDLDPVEEVLTTDPPPPGFTPAPRHRRAAPAARPRRHVRARARPPGDRGAGAGRPRPERHVRPPVAGMGQRSARADRARGPRAPRRVPRAGPPPGGVPLSPAERLRRAGDHDRHPRRPRRRRACWRGGAGSGRSLRRRDPAGRRSLEGGDLGDRPGGRGGRRPDPDVAHGRRRERHRPLRPAVPQELRARPEERPRPRRRPERLSRPARPPSPPGRTPPARPPASPAPAASPVSRRGRSSASVKLVVPSTGPPAVQRVRGIPVDRPPRRGGPARSRSPATPPAPAPGAAPPARARAAGTAPPPLPRERAPRAEHAAHLGGVGIGAEQQRPVRPRPEPLQERRLRHRPPVGVHRRVRLERRRWTRATRRARGPTASGSRRRSARPRGGARRPRSPSRRGAAAAGAGPVDEQLARRPGPGPLTRP